MEGERVYARYCLFIFQNFLFAYDIKWYEICHLADIHAKLLSEMWGICLELFKSCLKKMLSWFALFMILVQIDLMNRVLGLIVLPSVAKV